jgi:hypothetical protein
MRSNAIALVAAVMMLAATSCKVKIIEDSSAFAARAGQSTVLLGSSCHKDLELGYGYCPIKKGAQVPPLKLYFFNAADYAVSDCQFGIFKTGSVNEPGEVEIDLSSLTDQVQKQHFCLLRIEAIERYPDPRDKKQFREIPLVGGFFIETLDDNYFPEPSDAVTSWCVKVSGTNKGRRKIEKCR